MLHHYKQLLYFKPDDDPQGLTFPDVQFFSFLSKILSMLREEEKVENNVN